jgi:hypothetical protein
LYEVGPLSQLPLDVVRVLPTYAWPPTVGAAVFTGVVADVAAVARAAVTLATAATNPTNVNRLMVSLSLLTRRFVPHRRGGDTSIFGTGDVTKM